MLNFSQIYTPSKTFEVKILTEISPSNLLKNAFGGILRLQYRHKKEISKTFFDAGFETGLKIQYQQWDSEMVEMAEMGGIAKNWSKRSSPDETWPILIPCRCTAGED